MKAFISTYLLIVSLSLIGFEAVAQQSNANTGSIIFNGTDQFIAIENVPNLKTEITTSIWVKPNSGDNNGQKTLVAQMNSNDGWSMGLSTTNQIEVSLKNNGNITTITSNTYLSNNVWRHLSFTIKANTISLYIDGILDKQQSIASFENSCKRLTIGAANSNTLTSKFFKGGMDELRIWDIALNQSQLRYFMNQEIVEKNNLATGSIVSISSLELPHWKNLTTYYKFNDNPISTNIYDNSIYENHSDNELVTFYRRNQEAPIPYRSLTNGDWDNFTTWDNGASNFIPGTTRIVNGKKVMVEWNIVATSHDIDLSRNAYLQALKQDRYTLTIHNDNVLHIDSYLKIDGTIELRGESQLVQPLGSILDKTSLGVLKRSQKGSGSKYVYNYWSSPVSQPLSNTINNGFKIQQVMLDGSNPTQPAPLNFTSPENPDGSPSTPNQAATVSSRWIYTYANEVSGVYSNWQFVGKDGDLNTGQGYSMKGTGSSSSQNYTFVGLPNNGSIQLDSNAGNDYLIGNPYPSAMSANTFIQDNPHLDGTLYYWEHQAGDSHDVDDYDGAYAMYNLSGGTPNATKGSGNALINQNGSTVKIPGPYIPVAQGFFVIVKDDGKVDFNNGQRAFKKENSDNGVFMRAPGSDYDPSRAQYEQQEDTRTKIRIGFDSPNLIHRQLLLTVDPNASKGYDRGYDGVQFDDQQDDMAFSLGGNRLSIQGIDSIENDTELPLYIKLSDHGMITIGLDHVENLDPRQDVYLKDSDTGILYNLRESKFQSPFLFRGQYKSRFSIVFKDPGTLSSTQVNREDDILVYTPAGDDMIVIEKPSDLSLTAITLVNMLGQQVRNWNNANNANQMNLSSQQIASGTYILKMDGDGTSYARKILLD